MCRQGGKAHGVGAPLTLAMGRGTARHIGGETEAAVAVPVPEPEAVLVPVRASPTSTIGLGFLVSDTCVTHC